MTDAAVRALFEEWIKKEWHYENPSEYYNTKYDNYDDEMLDACWDGFKAAWNMLQE